MDIAERYCKYHDMLDKLAEKTYSVTMQYDFCGGSNFVICTIARNLSNKSRGVQRVGEDDLDALQKTSDLLMKIKNIEMERGNIQYPLLEEQCVIGGYCTKRYPDDMEITFKRAHDNFWITDVQFIDRNGFLIIEQPYKPTKKMTKVDPDEYKEYHIQLNEGEELYAWDTLERESPGGTPRSKGLAIVKDKQVIKTRTLAMCTI